MILRQILLLFLVMITILVLLMMFVWVVLVRVNQNHALIRSAKLVVFVILRLGIVSTLALPARQFPVR
jgi:hypothetical protein